MHAYRMYLHHKNTIHVPCRRKIINVQRVHIHGSNKDAYIYIYISTKNERQLSIISWDVQEIQIIFDPTNNKISNVNE